MKKVIALILACIVAVAAYTNPIYAAESEVVEVTVSQEVQALGVTPKLSIPKLATIPTIKPVFNFKIDFSKYIPKIERPPEME